MADEKKAAKRRAARRPRRRSRKGARAAAREAGRGRAAARGRRPSRGCAKHYEEKVVPALMKKFGTRSVMQVPRLVKIVVNMGVGDAIRTTKLLDAAANELAQITGPEAAVRAAKKSIANFKLREGLPIGCMVTLRGARMCEFYDRLVNVAMPAHPRLPRVSPRSFDGRGNYTLGLKEQIIFPEINYDKVEKVRGMDVTIVTTARPTKKGASCCGS